MINIDTHAFACINDVRHKTYTYMRQVRPYDRDNYGSDDWHYSCFCENCDKHYYFNIEGIHLLKLRNEYA